MPNICLKDLTEKQRDAWTMRYRYGWRLKHIAIELGTHQPAVSRLLRRARSVPASLLAATSRSARFNPG